MPCYSPLEGWKTRKKNAKGNYVITFKLSEGWKDRKMTVACGQCVGCRLDRSKEWAMRCMHEAALHEHNSFITLTYRDSPGTLIKRDVQLFMKSLREKTKHKIRFYMCGEYGEREDSKNIRKEFEHPHYHIILFGHKFEDQKLWTEQNGYKYYRSKQLENLWKHGYSTIGTVTYESSSYVARYILKKVLGVQKKEWYKDVEPEYTCMSRRPGVARGHIEKYAEQIYRRDQVIIKGKPVRPAKYYDKIFDLTNPEQLETVKKERRLKALKKSKDNTPERLEVRKYIAEQKLKLQTRKLKGWK